MKLLKYMTLALVAGFLLYGTGAAAADIFETAFNVTLAVFKNVRYIVYIIGGFGLIGLAVAAILGKMQFKWLVYVCLGLAIVAAADLIVNFATDGAINSPGSIGIQNMSSQAVANSLREGSSGSSERDTSGDNNANKVMRTEPDMMDEINAGKGGDG